MVSANWFGQEPPTAEAMTRWLLHLYPIRQQEDWKGCGWASPARAYRPQAPRTATGITRRSSGARQTDSICRSRPRPFILVPCVRSALAAVSDGYQPSCSWTNWIRRSFRHLLISAVSVSGFDWAVHHSLDFILETLRLARCARQFVDARHVDVAITVVGFVEETWQWPCGRFCHLINYVLVWNLKH